MPSQVHNPAMAKTLEEHYGYLSDRVKIERYRQAIEKRVQPGHVVLDLGCGTGLLGLMALRAGANKVLFVDEGPVIEVARRTVTEAGFAERAAFLQANSFELSLPERVDVVLCDHVGYFGFDYGILALLADARARFLKPGGIVVPQSIDMKLAPVESEQCRRLVNQWQDGSVPADYAWLAETAANTRHAVQLATTATCSPNRRRSRRSTWGRTPRRSCRGPPSFTVPATACSTAWPAGSTAGCATTCT